MRKDRIRERLRWKPHLLLVENDVFNIAERLRRHDPSLFVVFNTLRQQYEVHSLENKGDSFSLNLGPELDARAEMLVRRNSIRIHGKKLFRDMDERNAAVERSQERKRHNDIDAFARELHKPVKKLAYWGP